MSNLDVLAGSGVLVVGGILLITVLGRMCAPPKVERKYRATRSSFSGWFATLLHAGVVVGATYFIFSEVITIMVTVAEVVVFFRLMKWGIYGKSLRDSNGEKGASVLDPDVASGMTGWNAFATLTVIHGFVAVTILSVAGFYQGWW